MNHRIRIGMCSLAFVGIALLVGCEPPLGKISGIVTLDGAPVQGAEVNFDPVNPELGTTGTGYTQADGSYSIHYPGKKVGVPPGDYTVSIMGGEAEDEEGEADVLKMPKAYNRENTELKATVTGGDNVFDWELTSAGGE